MGQFALAGNPNIGKTSLFNILTGTYEYVGNWSGVTVEKKIGKLRKNNGTLIDLPGVYSLNPMTADETVVTRFLLEESNSTILNIVNAAQLKRNLYLTIQLLEYEKPLLIALNMVDVAKNNGIQINTKKLEKLLHVPVVPIIARTGWGRSELEEQLQQTAGENVSPLRVNYGDLEYYIEQIASFMPEGHISKRWLALQIIENNEIVISAIREKCDYKKVESLLAAAQTALQTDDLEMIIRKVRNDFIHSIIEEIEEITEKNQHKKLSTEKVDALFMHRYLGMPIFLVVMFLIFKVTFDWVGGPLSDLLDGFISGPITDWIAAGLTAIGASSFLEALVLDGIVAGVGGVLVFIPQIFTLFLLISLIEDSGYMTRVAVVMDKLLEKVGLNGKAFIPMIIGFGCNVPGVMAARTIEQPKERLLTILLTPLMSCSARLPVYTLFAGIFFASNQALLVLSLYVLGIVVALLLALIFSKTMMKGEPSMFIVELPPYRMPHMQTLFRSTWEKGKGFLRKAGTIIFAGSVMIWFLSYAGPAGFNVEMKDSYLALLGNFLGTLFAPLGFGTWQAGAALITGFLAKEVVVSTMNIIYQAPDIGSLQGVIGQHFTMLKAYSFMAFILLYVPCLATVGVIKKETGSWKWTWFSILYGLTIAYILSFLIYQGGKLLGLE